MIAEEGTPGALGYRWPAEWERHRATWLSWPHNQETWPGRFAQIPRQFADLVRLLADYEPVNILAGGRSVLAEARRHVGDVSGVRLFDIPTNDAWCRDHGPTFLVGCSLQPPALVDWQYNAWGGKYPPFDADNRVPQCIAEQCGYRRFQPRIVLEGGAIDGNGCGMLLATRSCLLDPRRNPQADQPSMEQVLHAYLGVERIVWLAHGELAGDDTDGHVDQLARFVAPSTIVAAVQRETDDANHTPLQANLAQLRALVDDQRRSLEVIPLPLPAAKSAGRQRLPASYCNFYIANDVVVVPQFNDPADQTALGTLRDLFPRRKVCGFNALDFVAGLGAIHCLTQQECRPPAH